ncbi:diguanylate cyclase [Arcobacter sp. FWKO B]|uniref:sensor domain-containing diguanylate cyclase n=1 Tax=Arcobacter sp. FWKO B TaxID=2593672 RepID=UPI0018A42BC6|nr:diguanylate cyclase [Arcobacter sp. FWKO B]QOG12124.1 diguanylate cyclase [Arcobacter sp. FWKO B]
MKDLSVKNRTLIFIFFIMVMSLVALFYLLDNYEHQRLEHTKHSNYLSIKTSYDKNIIQNLQTFYNIQAQSILSDEIIEAFAKRDRETLFLLVQNKYKLLRDQDEFFYQMHFHSSDGTSFLRAHKPELFGEDITKLRPMAKAIHIEQKPISGFEMGLHALSYRIFVPVFHNSTYIGALELGILPNKVLHLVTYFNEIYGLLFIYKESLKSNINSIQFTNITDKDLIDILPIGLEKASEYSELTYNDKFYSIYKFPLIDFVGNNVGEFIFFNDLSAEHKLHNDTKINFYIIIFISAIFVFFIINYGFNQIISKLQDAHIALKEYTKIIEEISITDALTNLYNRRYFNEILPRLTNSCKRDDDYISFLILDIDYFKQYNDTYGHKAGDIVLQDVANVLKDSLKRGTDYAFRIGGEEFCILFKGLNPNEAFLFSDKIRQNIENLKIPHIGSKTSKYVTASFGLVVFKGTTIPDETKLYTLADEELYHAKENGKNQVSIKK